MEEDKLNALVFAFEENDEISEDDEPLLKISQNKKDVAVSGKSDISLSLPASIQSARKVPIHCSDRDVFDPDFGIRVSNPRIGLSTSNIYCTGMKKLKIGQLRATSIPSDEWATMAVIVGKTECRKSAKNNEYCIWRVTDLINPQAEPCKVLLFGECVKQYWKLQIGMVVIITNAQVADSTSNSHGLSLKVFKITQVLEIGYCPDFAHCKEIKPSGEACLNYVNSSKSDYCTYHIRNAARKLCANRGTFSQLSSVMPKKLRHRETLPESSLGLITVNRGTSKKFIESSNFHAKRQLKGKEENALTAKSRPKPYNIGMRNGPKSTENLTPKAAINSPQHPRLVSSSQPTPKSLKEFIRQEINKPKLASRAEIGGFINLASPEKVSMRQLNEEMKIKRAVAILKNSSPTISFSSSTSVTKLRNVTSVEKQQKPSNILGGTFSDSDIMAMLKKDSRHEHEAAEEDQERENQYFDNKAAEEKVETTITTLMDVKNCKVVTCKDCNYTSLHQSSYCLGQGHDVQRHTADKRFFRCKDCHQRIICFEVLPVEPCQRCHGKSYERVAMKDERKIKEEKLMLRGEERKFIK